MQSRTAPRLLGIMLAIALSGLLSGCSSLAGQHALMGVGGAATAQLNRITKKTIYDLKGGERVADVRYRSDLATVRTVAEAECEAAPSWSEIELTYTPHFKPESAQMLLTAADGSVLRIELTEPRGQSDEVRLRATMKTATVESGTYGMLRARSSGIAVPVFAGVLMGIDQRLTQAGIKKISGGFTQRVTVGARRPHVAAPPAGLTHRPDSQVQQVQAGLNGRGYECGPADGLMGARTRRCIEDFQRDQGLQATGLPDQETVTLLAP